MHLTNTNMLPKFYEIPRTTILLLAVLALAAFFRFWQLDLIPPGLYPDVAINGNEALSNPGQIFYPENNGREGLMINLIALSFALFGISVWSIKAVAAIFGTLTVLGTYLLTKELFSQSAPGGLENKAREQNETVALLSSFFLAISFWHVNFSRFGFRAILLSFVLVFSFYFLFRGFRMARVFDLIAAAIFFGLGFYTYSSFRVAVLLLPLPIISFWLLSRKEKWQKKFFILSFLFLAIIFFVALPIGLYFLSHPADFASRAAPISVFAQENPIQAFLISFVRHLAMFNMWGDPNWRHNYSGSPQLLWPVGFLFLIGLVATLKKLAQKNMPAQFLVNKAEKHSNILQNVRMFFCHRNADSLPYLFLLSWFFIFLLPGALTYEGLPHSLRTIGVIPVPYIFAAIGGWTMWQWLLAKNVRKKLLLFSAFFFLAMLAFAEYNKYFILWGQNKETEGAFTKSYVEIGNYLNSLPERTKKYVIVNEGGVPVPLPDGLPMPAQTPMFIERTKYGEPRAIYLKPENLDAIVPAAATIIVPMKDDESLFSILSQKFLQGKITTENGITVFNLGLPAEVP
ncbi:MAG: hypothetical protein UY15_C0026G0006 [Parcubacteria group bacterium GW2011_GWA2_47_9]|uniref:Glycosyltransferase RgtA/B/C/D-like domain-containing protein n=2 Tax=Candidatus Wildermuthiibacteriota TaxID=1817923 RepID=A0A1G2R2Z8_9BACT|nr:MAG: hypothetical protein UY15_C0026G0006 [Parcubacteria group bacterium GW2011_GWA2_47_9]OHA66958.1 MAG: hypothetical protein A3D59_01895 [Candidatus Wildermuthbacteria bacterium RIFCSPHIGHO2_02_FULL_47_17]